jgi:hypothetical protein
MYLNEKKKYVVESILNRLRISRSTDFRSIVAAPLIYQEIEIETQMPSHVLAKKRVRMVLQENKIKGSRKRNGQPH